MEIDNIIAILRNRKCLTSGVSIRDSWKFSSNGYQVFVVEFQNNNINEKKDVKYAANTNKNTL